MAGGSTSPKPLAGDKWLIYGVFLGPPHCNLLAWHQRERGFAVCILLSTCFTGQIPWTLSKPYGGEPPMESVEAFSKRHLNEEIEDTAKGKDGPGELIGLFHHKVS